ncbi:MAG: DinB family protein [Gemmatimonadaceae bacterium]
MDPRLEGLAAQLGLHSRLFLKCLDGVSEAAAAVRPGGTNNMAFIAAHLVDARHWLARLVGLAVENPFAQRLADARTIDDLKDCPSVAESRVAWSALARPLEAHIGTLEAPVLDSLSPTRFPVSDKSVLGAIAFLVHHEAYHIGQLAVLRRYTGSPAMSYR